MPVKRIPSRRSGIATVPGHVEIVFSRPPADDEVAAIRAAIPNAAGYGTFDYAVRPAELWAEEVLGGAGKQPGAFDSHGDRTPAWYARAILNELRIVRLHRDRVLSGDGSYMSPLLRDAMDLGGTIREAVIQETWKATGEAGRKGGRPGNKRAAADRWLRDNESVVRAQAKRRNRDGLATWALAEMKLRVRPSLTVMKDALRDLLGPQK